MISIQNAEAATNCTQCARIFLEVTRNGDRIFKYKNDLIVAVICPKCDAKERMESYRSNGEIVSSLMTESYSAVSAVEGNRLDSMQPAYANIFRTYYQEYREINSAVNEISDCARLAEIAVWFGRPDLATTEELARSREESGNWDSDYKIENGEHSIQTYYRNTKNRGHSFEHDDYKVMLWGMAGRVLITINDSRKFGDKLAKYGGASITLIYDETAEHPRGGIQSLTGTKKELLGLIEALRSNQLKFSPDEEVTIG